MTRCRWSSWIRLTSSICTGWGSSDRPEAVLAQRALEERHVEPVDVQGHVGQGVIGDQIEGHVGVAQGQVEIDEGDVVVRVLGQRGAEIDGEAGAADAAARAEHGDDLRLDLERAVAAAVGRCRRRSRGGVKRCRALSRSSSTTGAVRNSRAPLRRAWRIDWPSPRALTARIGMSGQLGGQLGDQLQGLGLVGIEGDDDDVGDGLLDHVEEELVARAFGFEPDRFHAEQQVAQRVAGGVDGSTMAMRCTSFMVLHRLSGRFGQSGSVREVGRPRVRERRIRRHSGCLASPKLSRTDRGNWPPSAVHSCRAGVRGASGAAASGIGAVRGRCRRAASARRGTAAGGVHRRRHRSRRSHRSRGPSRCRRRSAQPPAAAATAATPGRTLPLASGTREQVGRRAVLVGRHIVADPGTLAAGRAGLPGFLPRIAQNRRGCAFPAQETFVAPDCSPGRRPGAA